MKASESILRVPVIGWLAGAFIAYVFSMGYIVLLRYQVFQTNAFDLGIFNQAFSTALKGMLFYETPDQHLIPSGSFLGTHFSPLMFLLLPIYALYPHAQTLLLLQTFVVGLGAVPVYLLSRNVLSQRLGLVLSVAYLVNPAILSLNLYDFHLEAFLPFFLGMFYYFYTVSNWKGYFLFLALSLITIDFAALIVAAICLAHGLSSIARSPNSRFGFSLELDKKRRSILLGTIVLAALVFYTLIFLSGVVSGISTSVQGILSGFLSQPRSESDFVSLSEFWLFPLATLMFLPLLAPRQLVMVAPWFFATILETAYPTDYSFGYQYAGAFVVPFLLIAAVFAIRGLRRRKAEIRGFLVGVFILSIAISPLNPLTQGHISGIAYEEGLPTVTPHDSILDYALSLIPSNASVLTQNNVFPQLSARPDAYVYLADNTSSIRFVLADTISSWYSTLIWGTQSMKSLLPRFMANPAYGLLVNDDGVILLEENYHGPPLLTGPTDYIYNFHQLDLNSGMEVRDPNSTSGTVLYHSSSEESGVSFWFGPYASLPPGTYNATFYLESKATTNGSLDLIVSNFVNASSITILAQHDVTQASFPHPSSWNAFTLQFQYNPQEASSGLLEFRGFSVSGGPFLLDYISVSYVAPVQ